ncbi:MAG: hypothetical protein QF911_05125 [Candidatus Thalassarchaeaceae archaeon]|nr:hypothetical protein [Candidatus Thalassarchaeaceae archaeon]
MCNTEGNLDDTYEIESRDLLIVDEDDWSYWRVFVIGLCVPFVPSIVVIGILYLLIGSGFLFAFASTCIWPVAGFGFAAYSRIYESDELAEGALASGVLGTLLGVFMVYKIVTFYAEGMASFSQ